MIHPSATQVFFPQSNQKYNQNIYPGSSKMVNYNFTGYQTSNIFYPKANSHKKLNAFILTDQNFNSINMPNPVINTPQIIKAGYNNVLSNTNENIASNNEYIVKYSSARRIKHITGNINALNNSNSNAKGEKQNILNAYKQRISEDLMITKNNYFTPRVERVRKDCKIPHPQISIKKRLADAFNSQASKYNTEYNDSKSQYFLNQSGSSNYNTTISSVKNTTNTLTNILNSSLDNITNKNTYLEEEPPNNFALSDFTILSEIGKGTEGTIYVALWKRNNKKYALKKIMVTVPESINKRKEDNAVIKNFIESTGCDSIIKPIASTYIKNQSGYYDLYEIIELAENDWEKDILKRKETKNYYSEPELMAIFKNIINTFYLLQEHHITHRDIKPQNILIANGKLKICDFGNARILKRQGVIIQRIRGSELFMSPIVFEGYRAGKQNIRHNAYKSDVFSLGMCFFLAASLSYDGPNVVRLLYDMNEIKKVLKYNLSKRYSEKVINMLLTMLQVEEKKRPDFIELKALYP